MKLPLLFVLLIANALGAAAWAADLPAGGVVAAGTASFATGANSLQVNQGSNRAIINWNSFSVGAGKTVQFVQPSASSAVLNRVVAANPSRIYGSITANGQVFLVNPGGIYVGPSGTIHAAGIFLSTGDISNADFLADNIRFGPATADTPIVISGRLDAADMIDIRASALDCSNCTLNAPTIFVDAPAVTPPPALTPLSITPPTSHAPLLPASFLDFSSAAAAPTSGGGVTINTGSIALSGPSGSLSLTGGTLSLGGGNLAIGTIDLPGISTGGAISLRGSASAQPAATSPSPATVPPALRTGAPAARLSNSGNLVDGAVTVRMSLVDAAPISLR